ncbi:probable ubiquitin carboxyl-terminal hydrolase MINDY-4 isoform X2 [Gigantopelta aegis]|nr:probable ubiquitin carboxyl-terminal hydrolase MINDY-4 isoform X2 [Gigantopelta aegis]
MKEIKLEKLMKKNKEQEKPLRTMIEVMTKYFVERSQPGLYENRTSVKHPPVLTTDGEQKSILSMAEHIQPDGPSKASTNSRYLSSQKQISAVISPPLIDSTRLCGYTSPADKEAFETKPRPSSSVLNSKIAKSNKNDVVIEDDLDSETLVGAGKAGVFFNSDTGDQAPRTRFTQPVPSRTRGVASPITSNLDESQRRRAYQRPKSRFTSYQGKSNGSSLTNSDSPRQAEHSGIDTLLDGVSRSSPLQQDLVSPSKPETIKKPVSITDVIEKSSERLNELSRKMSEPQILDEQSYSVAQSSMANRTPGPHVNSVQGSLKEGTKSSNDMELTDIGDLETELDDVQLEPVTQQTQILNLNKLDFKPIDLQTAVALKTVILGSANQNFVDEWRYQGFSFCDIPDLQYGIVQKKGGPCGVLASVQACFLQEMLFGESLLPKRRSLQPTCTERSMYLATALSRIFWRAGSQLKAVVTVPSGRAHVIGSSRFKSDDLTEMLMLYTFIKYEELLSFMRQTIHQFEMDGNGGIILALYSSVLSRGVDKVRSDFDEPEGKLMAAHFYCTQEIVNLFLTGRAVANVFNDVIELDSGGGAAMILRGIHQRSHIGFLSLFEHYKSCQVGTYYKTPRHPIWVVCSESHFSVLFSTNQALTNDWKAERRFDLHYYDGLARQQEPIKLTVSTTNRSFVPPSDGELVPPLEHCIRTKWKDAEIDWNGYEPIL